MPTTVATGIRFWHRSELGLRAPRDVTVASDKTEFFVHYSTGEERGRVDTRDWWREIQAFHMGAERGWDDIAYGHGVDIFGNIFEGRGFHRVQAHCPGHNTQGTSVVFLGDDDPGQDVPEVARRAIRWLYLKANREFGHNLKRYSHRQFRDTRCPGDELARWVAAGMPTVAPPAPKPTVVVRPTPPRFLGRTLALKRPLMYGRDVRMWQAQMKRRGWEIDVDNYFGPQCREVCMKFQKEKHRTVTGKVDKATWDLSWTAKVTA